MTLEVTSRFFLDKTFLTNQTAGLFCHGLFWWWKVVLLEKTHRIPKKWADWSRWNTEISIPHPSQGWSSEKTWSSSRIHRILSLLQATMPEGHRMTRRKISGKISNCGGWFCWKFFFVFEQSAISHIYDQHRIKWFIISFVLVNYINVFKHHLVRVSRCELILEDNFKVSGVAFFSVGFSPARWAPVFHLQHPSIQKIDAFYRSCISMSYMVFICISYVDTKKRFMHAHNSQKVFNKRCNSPWLSAPHFFPPNFFGGWNLRGFEWSWCSAECGEMFWMICCWKILTGISKCLGISSKVYKLQVWSPVFQGNL